jgi:hypothetical protein
MKMGERSVNVGLLTESRPIALNLAGDLAYHASYAETLMRPPFAETRH